MLLTVFTPTYNRCHRLKDCYNSLRKQKVFNFEWLIIDDGSTDGTKEIVSEFIENETNFKIRYFYKKNGGKHTAWNYSHDKIDTELTMVLDSDDVLTDDATEIIQETYKSIKCDNISGFIFLRGNRKKDVIGTMFPTDQRLLSYIDIINLKNIKGDKSEVYFSNVFKEFKFIEFEDERLMSELAVFIPMSYKYKFYTFNKVIYITEYLEDGLTHAGRKLNILCPKGGMLTSKMRMSKLFSFDLRLKYGVLYNCYAFFSKKKQNLFYLDDTILIRYLTVFPGLILYFYWKIKYKIR